jgi:flagellin
MSVQVLMSAQHAALVYHGQAAGLSAPVSISVAGANGTVQLSFASSTSATVIASAVNALSAATGVTASASANDVSFVTTGYGSKQFVSVTSSSPALQTQTLAGVVSGRGVGRDATVSLNGQTTQSDGLSVIARNNGFDATFSLNTQSNTNGATAQFAITGGGATFSLDGLANDTTSLGLNSFNTASLGYAQPATQSYTLADLGSSGAASLKSGHLDVSQQVVNNAIRDVSEQRARIGAFRAYDIQSTINFLNVKLENLSSAESSIRDTDFATEAANLAREQILAQSSQAALSAAEQNQQILLKLLGA